MPALWTIWLLQRDQEPFKFFDGLTEGEAMKSIAIASNKVFDGSDADAFMLTRSDYTWRTKWIGVEPMQILRGKA